MRGVLVLVLGESMLVSLDDKPERAPADTEDNIRFLSADTSWTGTGRHQPDAIHVANSAAGMTHSPLKCCLSFLMQTCGIEADDIIKYNTHSTLHTHIYIYICIYIYIYIYTYTVCMCSTPS